MNTFEPTRHAALERLAQVQPDAYARTRNFLDGAVTRLGPYITHGLLSLSEVYERIHARTPLAPQHKLVFELGWRAYWRHVWSHRGDGLHRSQHPGLLADEDYQHAMPADVQEARTGIPAIDQAVRELYTNGYLHNHARMWLASYLIHLRKVHWHTGAQWMLGHLLDGDLASNHLSWQWVAGTFSAKPYLFNADNVAKYAPAHWHSPGSVIDTSYEALDRIARSPHPIAQKQDHGSNIAGIAPMDLSARPSSSAWTAPEASTVTGRDVCLLHPWSMGYTPTSENARVMYIGLGLAPCHARTPWSERRWQFVTQGLQTRCERLWWGSAQEVARALAGARSVRWQAEAHANPALEQLRTELHAHQGGPRVIVDHPHDLFEPVRDFCPSFSKWWKQTALRADTSTPDLFSL